MEELILFLITFVFVFLCYQIFIVSKTKKKKAKNSKDFKDPIEIRYLASKYKLDMDKVDYNQLLQIVAITSSLDITIVVTLITLVNSFVFEILLAVVSVFPIIIGSYYLVSRIYKKKGMIINE